MQKKRVLFALSLAGGLWGQSAGEPRGHWTGALELPNRTMNVAIDLDKTGEGWVGSMAVPEQGVTGIELRQIRLEEGQWKFNVTGPPGNPAFAGRLSADGKTLDGEMTQGGKQMALKLTHAGAPRVEVPKASPAVAEEFVGEWEGTLEGAGLRLRVKIHNEAGRAKAVLISLDQGNAELPAGVEQEGKKLTLDVKMVKGGFTGELNAAGTAVAGEWSQNGQKMALVLQRKQQ